MQTLASIPSKWLAQTISSLNTPTTCQKLRNGQPRDLRAARSWSLRDGRTPPRKIHSHSKASSRAARPRTHIPTRLMGNTSRASPLRTSPIPPRVSRTPSTSPRTSLGVRRSPSPPPTARQRRDLPEIPYRSRGLDRDDRGCRTQSCQIGRASCRERV